MSKPPAGRRRELVDQLRLRGAEHNETVDVLAWDLTGPRAELTADDATELRVIARLEGEPVSTGGGTLADDEAVLRRIARSTPSGCPSDRRE